MSLTIVWQMLWTDRLTKRLIVVLAVLLLGVVLLSPGLVSAFAGLGGYISEKMLGDGANEAQHLGDGTSELTALGSAPIVSTGAVTNNLGSNATLNGTLSDLNGMPRADVWFEWGYDPSTLSNSTPTVVATVTGTQSVTITGFGGRTVYYRIAAGTDGTSRGAIVNFAGGRGVSLGILYNILPVIIAVVIFVLMLLTIGNPIVALAGAIIGLLAFRIAQALVQSML